MRGREGHAARGSVALVIFLSLGFLFIPLAARGDTPGEIVLSFSSPGSAPTGLTFGNGYLWCADEDTNTIYMLDPETGSVQGSFSSPSSSPGGLAWDANGYLWCADMGADRIHRIDPSNGSVISDIPSPGLTPRGLTFFDGYLRVSDSNSKLIYKVDPSSGSSLSDFSTAGSWPRGLAWDGSHLWHIDGEEGSIFRMDHDTGIIDMLIPEFCDFAYGLCWDGSHLWYADKTANVIYRVLRDGADYLSSSNPRYFSISFTHNTASVLGYCTTNLAVPPGNAHQSITREITYNPGGLDSGTDQWGQDISWYTRWVSGQSAVTWNTGAVTYDLRYIIDPDLCGTVADIPSGIISEYTADGDNYDITNQVIVDAANDAVGSETNLYWMYRNIHDYIIANVNYEAAGGWDPAPTVLSRGTGSCSEYSYVFVAVCRAAGLPARYQGGSRLRQENLPYTDSVFHRWHEMYIPHYGGWIPVDCTRDDRTDPGARLKHFGFMPNSFFITTTGGGDSTYLDWNYNSYDQWSVGGGSRTRSFYWYENSQAEASSAASAGGSGDIAATYLLTDAEGDWTHLSVEYSEDGGASWAAATEGIGGDGTLELAASPAGTSHTFVWESLTDIGYTSQSDIRLRVTPYVAGDGTPAETANFQVNNLTDTDGDGLFDEEEGQYGTGIDNPDTDGDNFSDLVEIAAGSDPLTYGWTANVLKIRISFQPAYGERPTGFATDSGSSYDQDRAYGWNP